MRAWGVAEQRQWRVVGGGLALAWDHAALLLRQDGTGGTHTLVHGVIGVYGHSLYAVLRHCDWVADWRSLAFRDTVRENGVPFSVAPPKACHRGARSRARPSGDGLVLRLQAR